MNSRRYERPVPRLATLHVAALPYPTTQGTQAAIGCMVDALVREGRTSALLTYASGAGDESRFPHRTPAGLVRPRSLRSGPSLEKIAADAELALALRTQAREAEVVVAHHVEAAAIAHALRLPRWVFVAHTSLGPELPTYLPRLLGPIASHAGRGLDGWLASRAPGLAAISKNVARDLATLTGRDAVVLPVPIARPAAPAPASGEARQALDLAPEDEVVLYAGNLDAYQGLDVLVDAVAELRARRPRATMLIASQSAPEPLRARFARCGVIPRFVPLATESDRALVHAAADLAVVTRGAPGGFPIKLLDAVSREVPIVAMRRALSGEEVPGVLVTADDARSLARGLEAVLGASAGDRSTRVRAAHQHLARTHDAASFVRALDTAIDGLMVGR
jgi:glycosyltransferase involved in cell wall biosynthesis